LKDPISKKPITQKRRLVEWLKVQALSSNPVLQKQKCQSHNKKMQIKAMKITASFFYKAGEVF
jgi:hypothetical protein